MSERQGEARREARREGGRKEGRKEGRSDSCEHSNDDDEGGESASVERGAMAMAKGRTDRQTWPGGLLFTFTLCFDSYACIAHVPYVDS